MWTSVSVFILLSLLSVPRAFELGLAPALNLTQAAYEAELRPNAGAVADTISVSVDSLSVRQIRTENQEILLDLVLNLAWTDPRLSSLVQKPLLFTVDILRVWTPHVLLVGALPEAGVESMSSRSLRLKPGGEVLLSQRFVARIPCEMHFFKLPFDRQSCPLSIEAPGQSTLHLDLVWRGSVKGSTLFDSQFSLDSLEQRTVKERRTGGEFTTLHLDINFQRNGLQWLRRLLLPTLLIAILAYATLYMPSKQPAGHPLPTSTWVLLCLTLRGILLFLYFLLVQLSFVAMPPSTTALDVFTLLLGIVPLVLCLSSFCRLVRLQADTEHVDASTQSPDADAECSGGSCSEKLDQTLVYGVPIFMAILILVFISMVLI